MSYRLGVDIGGTFTDLAVVDERDGRMSIHKLLTTPDDPARAVLNGISELLAAQEIPIDQVNLLSHGTTLITNALIERKGGRTAMLATAGFADVLDIGIENKYDLYDLRLVYPPPLVPRELQREVAERVLYDGTVEQPLDLAQVRKTVRELVQDLGAEAIAVCLLHAYLNPVHEQQIKALCQQEFPGVYVSLSSEVLPFMREYERWTTTAINSFSQPLADVYLSRLEQGLASLGYGGHFTIMTSNGGTVTTDTARRFPVRLLESGPAAGVLMASHQSLAMQRPNLLSFDMGGTTAKGALVIEHQPLKKYELEVARTHEYKRGSGFPARIPVIDMIEIGIGGGSIAHIDVRGVIKVGPLSAGAMPGPACYGQGGTEATNTDADLVLGYLDPRFFLGGRMALDQSAAERAILATIGKPLDVDVTRAAWGIHQTVNESVAQAFRLHASERGHDLRGFGMMAFGGSGPVHAARIARILGIREVILPMGAGVMSAVGLLVSPLSFETVRSKPVLVSEISEEDFTAGFAPLVSEASAFLHEAGVAEQDVFIRRRLDMRYQGQGYEIEVVLPDTPERKIPKSAVTALFQDAYERIFTTIFDPAQAEIVNWKVEAVGPSPESGGAFHLVEAAAAADARKGTRRAYFPELDGYVDCPVYDRYALAPESTIQGPALIEERESTCVIGAKDVVRVDAQHNLIIELTELDA